MTIYFELGPNLLKLGVQIVASLADFTAKFDSLDAKITAIAAEIADLKTKIASGGMTETEEQTALDRLTTLEAAVDAAK